MGTIQRLKERALLKSKSLNRLELYQLYRDLNELLIDYEALQDNHLILTRELINLKEQHLKAFKLFIEKNER